MKLGGRSNAHSGCQHRSNLLLSNWLTCTMSNKETWESAHTTMQTTRLYEWTFTLRHRLLAEAKSEWSCFTYLLAIIPLYRNHTHTFNSPFFPWLPGWAGTRKIKPIWILLKQETVSGSGISWAICKSAPRSRQITMPAPHHSDFYRPDALPAAQPTASKYWRPLYRDHLSVFAPSSK